MIAEIREIPEKAGLCYLKNKKINLPENVPYLGMGSSYFAPLVLKYLGCRIDPEIASEYYNFMAPKKENKLAVLLSQSGRSSETLWNAGIFDSYIAIVNDQDSPLAKSAKAAKVIMMHAGTEKFSSTKTYINTLIVLYQGLGFDIWPVINIIKENLEKYEEWGEKNAGIIYDQYNNKKFNGIYVMGNGPNLGTSYEASLILTETTKIPVTPMAISQYDHGPKESARDSIVIVIKTGGGSEKRMGHLLEAVKKAGATILLWEEKDTEEYLSPFTAIMPLNCLAYFLSKKLDIPETFSVGNKVTTVN